MAMRQMVGTRKGGGLPTVPTNAAGSDATANATDSAPDDSDVVECPNCQCQFNETTQDVVKAGLPVEQGPDDAQGVALATEPPPGDPRDAAYGDGIIGNVLAKMKSRVG